MKNKHGQSTLEYILVVAAVVLVMIAFVVGPTSPFKGQLNRTLNAASAAVNLAAGHI